jgi:hypothetical protein
MFPLNTILAWSINIIMNKKYDNNNIIIASRAYFLHSMLERDAHFMLINDFLYICMLLIYCLCYHHHHVIERVREIKWNHEPWSTFSYKKNLLQ